MKRFFGPLVGVFAVAVGVSLRADLPRHPQFGFPIYTNAPPGRQVGGQHAPATSPPMAPADAERAFVVPPGFEVRLFASEPEIANPVAMTWDERGRLWVLEFYEYPLGAPPGQIGRDRVKILEDTHGDGRADKVTVFADGLNLATGLLVGSGGAYVGEAPNLWFMEDTDGNDVADRKTAVLTGFGLEDRHELLNGFAWGPDGQLYMTHGVFTHTKAVDPDQPDAAPVVLTAGVARLDPRTRRFEVFAEGTSNPWGVDFDRHGHAFVSACVIDHLFHLAPGGIYQRQAGQPPFPSAYGDLPSIVDHRHHMAAYAGICIYQGDQWPAAWQGATLHGNIHQHALNVDRLTPRGASFLASKWNESGDFLTTPDGWFMPVSIQTGPDGALWVMDWYDKYPCYQNANADPAGVDRAHGRIWRVVWTGDTPGRPVPSRPQPDLNLAKLTSAELVDLLAHPNVWHRRMAQRLLNDRRDNQVTGRLERLFANGPNLDARLAAFWTQWGSGCLTDEVLARAARDPEPAMRLWAARFLGEARVPDPRTADLLRELASDDAPAVRAAVATACRQFVSAQLTVNAPLPADLPRLDTLPILARLIEASRTDSDPTLAFLIWMAAEPAVTAEPARVLEWFRNNGRANLPLAGGLLHKTLRRLCDLREAEALNLAVELLDQLSAADAPLTAHALAGLIEGQRGKILTPTRPTEPVLRKLLASPDAEVVSRAQQLGSLWGDASAVQAGLARINDPAAAESDRLEAIRTARRLRNDETRAALLILVNGQATDRLRVEAVRALSEIGGDDTARRLLARWDAYTPSVRAAVAELCATRGAWKWPLYGAIERGDLQRGDIPPTVIRALATARNDREREKATELFGRVDATDAEKLRLIAEKREVVIRGPVDLAAGHRVARQACLTCHRLHGEGADVGPDLTGVGRSSLDALLRHVIHPNEIIGQGYEQVEVETRDGLVYSGRMTENTATHVKLVMAGPSEVIVDKSDLQSLHVSEQSAMPEGLEQMPGEDFRNLIWFILAPPADGLPLTEERRRELIGLADDEGAASLLPQRDGESLALWAPGWQVDCPDFEGAPAKLPEFAGRRNVLLTHPYDESRPAALVRSLGLPRDRRATLRVAVAAHERGDWELRVRADGELLHRQTVHREGPRWQEVTVDLSPLAGRRVVLRLENAANNWAWEFGYWSDLRLEETE